ncbi:hypothetical protein [Methanomassiliicoccus luminyensis]|nr:hypothetical protein [Methanomassiliicoccus luminyensis]
MRSRIDVGGPVAAMWPARERGRDGMPVPQRSTRHRCATPAAER